jgi:hypothetical protein
VCTRCKTPLNAALPASAPAAPKQTQWPLYIALGVAGILAIALVLVLMMR